MTQNDKELLLRDLCARLLYGVKVCKITDDVISSLILIGIHRDTMVLQRDDKYEIAEVNEVKLYLFPLSSMTEEQKEELDKYLDMDSKSLIDGYKNGLKCAHPYFNVQDWYNKNHFDYRGLIEMGLAINATDLNIY